MRDVKCIQENICRNDQIVFPLALLKWQIILALLKWHIISVFLQTPGNSHSLEVGAQWGCVSSRRRSLYNSSSLLPAAPHISRKGSETERKEEGQVGQGDKGPLGNESRCCCDPHHHRRPHSGLCIASPTLKVNTLNFSKSMAAEFSTMIVTWASFRTVCGTTRKMPPGPTSRRLNLALAPWATEVGERKQGRWMRIETQDTVVLCKEPSLEPSPWPWEASIITSFFMGGGTWSRVRKIE